MSVGPAIVRVWRYRVEAQHRVVFEQRYGSDGDWVRLFRQAGGFTGTQLWRDPLDPAIYLTLDHWRSASDFHGFLTRFGSQYAALDRICDALTSEEIDLGQYEDTGPG
ncbi:MAG: antibiotic biosynthesis monooxygenase family protein [Arenimonas sp.]